MVLTPSIGSAWLIRTLWHCIFLKWANALSGLKSLLFQPLTHHPVDNQRHEANLCVRPDSVGLLVARCNFYLRLQNPEASLNIGQCLVALHNFCGRQVRHVGHQHQLAVHQLRLCQGGLIYRVGEQIALEVHFKDVRQTLRSPQEPA